ncbi:MFS transporter [Nocardioides caldifontis]|uniref:MFS transporter n=1 Tax=Nocardioides caldifontis TaxID=2588938 RepID=UPI0011E02B7B|nr:MFS transporter [Nocardioides caldifontis]
MSTAAEGSVRGPEVRAAQRHTVGVLVASQALGGLGLTIGIAVAAVLAEEVSGSEALAGLVQTAQVLGAAVAALLLARVMGSRGRRPGLALGYVLGAAGAAVLVLGGAVESFWLLLVGAVLLGAVTATNLQSRYAAADLATPETRARDLSVVVWATTVGAVLGPNLVGPAGRLADRLGLPELTGPFLVSVVVVLVAALVLALLLRPDPLLLAREVAAAGQPAAPPPPRARGVVLLRSHPGISGSVLAMSAAHAVMVAVMVMTPLHMHHGGAELEVIGLVVSIHVLGMYFFSPLVGLLADRAGRAVVLVVGAGVLWVSLAVSGSSPAGASTQIGVGLFLLGLGWSFCTVAAAALLTESAPLEVRTDAQGAADLVMNVAAAAAGLLGGLVVEWWGFVALNGFAAVLVAGVVLAAVVARREPTAGAPSVSA